MSDDIIDFERDLKTGDIKRVTDKARELYVLEAEAKKLEKRLKEKKEEAFLLATEELPAIVREELNVDKIQFDNGYELEIKSVISGSIPTQSAITKQKDIEKKIEDENRRAECLAWLRENGAGSLIRNEIVIDIPRSDDSAKMCLQIWELVRELGLSGESRETVHAATLNKYIKEQLEKEDCEVDIPFDLFKVFCGEKAVIKEPKK